MKTLLVIKGILTYKQTNQAYKNAIAVHSAQTTVDTS
jgi:hypothetical protein